MYKVFIKPILFLFDPEWVHHTVFSTLKLIHRIPGMGNLIKGFYQVKDQRLERKLFGLTFPNPVGLAAGFDKDAKLYKELSDFGFGFIEIGTLTPKPQLEIQRNVCFVCLKMVDLSIVWVSITKELKLLLNV